MFSIGDASMFRLFSFGRVSFCTATLAVLASLPSAEASFVAIPGLYSTGRNTAGSMLPHNGTLNHAYTLISAPSSSVTQLVTITSAGGFPIGSWLADNADTQVFAPTLPPGSGSSLPVSQWIRPNNGNTTGGNDNDPVGTYVFRTTFTLDSWNFNTAAIVGRFATDNSGTIRLNGVAVGLNGTTAGINNPAVTSNGFGAWTNFSISSGFQAGLNTLDFVVNNASGATGNPTGLRASFVGSVFVPEPSTFGIFGLGLPLFGMIRRRVAR